jgi:hypothetical protein
LAISATDSNSGATLSYAASGLPAGLSVNAGTGVISGTVAAGNTGIGSFSPTITASDGTSSSSSTFNWSIGGALSLAAPSDQSNTVGDIVTLQMQATDSGGTPTCTASGLPAGLSINQSTGLISGTISSSATAIGSYLTTVTASDGSRSASVSFNWVVSAAGTITMTTPANQTSAEGATVSLSISATGGGTKSYFAEGLPPGLAINPSTGVIARSIGTS